MNIDKAIGLRIRKQRENLGYSREFMAEKLGVSAKFCSDIELGVKGMSINTLCKLSEILNLSTDYILFGKEADVTHIDTNNTDISLKNNKYLTEKNFSSNSTKEICSSTSKQSMCSTTNMKSENTDDFIRLMCACPNDKLGFIKEIIRNFIKSHNT